MAVRRGNMFIHMFVFLCGLIELTQQAPVADSAVADTSQPTGEFLTQLGTNFSSPLLRLLGKAFINYEGNIDGVVEARLTEKLCKLHPCTDWESWSKCPAERWGQFSMSTRTRDCSTNGGLCVRNTTGNEDVLKTTESKVCERICPNSYNFTGGFCLQLFKVVMTQYDAQRACEQDGGHLVNINTKAKSDAVHAVFNGRISSDTIWINGNRTQGNGVWQYTYGTVPDFENWHSDEPDNGPNELCKIETSSPRRWGDLQCFYKRYYFCEIV